MARAFHLSVVTPDGLFFDGQAESVSLRSVDGDVCILAGHSDYVAPLGMGVTRIVMNGKERFAATVGGIISVNKGEVSIIPTTFEWADEIDLNRAKFAKEKAEKERSSVQDKEKIALAEARLRRAMLRIGVNEKYSGK